jgi:HEAT repeat protein
MRRPRFRFTTRSIMAAVGICAVVLWIIVICYRYGWTWIVVRDVRRGLSTKYSVAGFRSAGPRAIDALREALGSEQVKTRMSAVTSLGRIGPDAKSAVSELANTARHDQDRNVRIFAVVSLGQIGPAAAEAVGPLVGLLEYEEDAQMILVTVEALGRIGPPAKTALPVLASMAKNPGHFAHVFAALAMCRIGPEGRSEAAVVLPTLITRLTTAKSARERTWAAEVLSEMAPTAGEAIPALEAATHDIDQEVRRAARRALELIKRVPSKTESGETQYPSTPSRTRNE